MVPGPHTLADADDLEDARHGVADGGGGGEGQVDDALLDVQTACRLAAHELAGAGDLEGGLLDALGDLHHVGRLGELGEGGGHDAGAGDADVDDGVRLARAVDGARHERRVLDHVGEADELGGAHGIAVRRELGGVDDGLGCHEDGVHVDASAQTRDVHARAHTARGGKRLGDAVDEAAVCVTDALVHEGGITAEVIDAEGLRRAVERMRERHEVDVRAGGGDLGDGRYGDTLVDNGNAILALEVLRGLHEVLGLGGDAVIHLGAHAVEVLVRATHERDAHGDGADVEVLLGHHVECLGDLFCSNRHDVPFVWHGRAACAFGCAGPARAGLMRANVHLHIMHEC